MDPALSAALVASSIPDAFKPRKLKSLEAKEVQHFREMLQFHKNRAIALKSEEWLALIEPKFHVAIQIRLRALLHHPVIHGKADNVLENLGSHRPIRCTGPRAEGALRPRVAHKYP